MNVSEGSEALSRVLIDGTVAEEVLLAIRSIFDREVALAKSQDKAVPSMSHVLEMVLRLGVKEYKRRNRL